MPGNDVELDEQHAATVSSTRAIGRIILATLTGIAAVAISCVSLDRPLTQPPAIDGADYVGNETCNDCHADLVRIFPESPHSRWHVDAGPASGMTGCESCHGPGSKHAQAPAEGAFILNPGKDPQSCLRCHLEVSGEFHLPHRHPVAEGKMNCVQCHDPHGREIFKPSRGLAIAERDETCVQCHREQGALKVFEHEALREGCTTCHQPHGSISAKMLVLRDSNLCLRCHAQVQGPSVAAGEFFIGVVPHGTLVSQGTCWSAGCHTAVHGSNVEPRMLY